MNLFDIIIIYNNLKLKTDFIILYKYAKLENDCFFSIINISIANNKEKKRLILFYL